MRALTHYDTTWPHPKARPADRRRRPEDSVLWRVAPDLAARMRPADLAAVEPGPDDRFTPDLGLLARLGCPTVVRQEATS